MAGYSATPLPKKLGIKVGSRLMLVAPPEGFAETLGAELPEGVTTGAGPVDVAIIFAEWEADLLSRVAEARPALRDSGGLWMAWPKRASKRPTDITEDRLRALYLPTGLVDNKVCAIDEVWSGLRFVLRAELRGSRTGMMSKT